MIDRYLIRYFLAVVDQGTFSRAAAQCNVSQPTLSVGIAKLERAVGSPLFLRSSQRVILTEAGTRFLSHARRIETEFNLALSAMTSSALTHMLRIGVLQSIPGAAVAGAVAVASRVESREQLEIIFGTERELIGHLARGRIDVALTLVGRGSDRFLEQALVTEGYALALPVAHELSSHAQIAAEDLADNVMIVRRHCEALSETSRHFTDRGVRPHFALRSTNDERVLQMVAAGLGVTVMPVSYNWPGVTRPSLAGFDLTRTIGFAFNHEFEHLLGEPPALLHALSQALLPTLS